MTTYTVQFEQTCSGPVYTLGTITMESSADPVAALIAAGMISPDNRGLEVGEWGGNLEVYAGAGRRLFTLTPA